MQSKQCQDTVTFPFMTEILLLFLLSNTQAASTSSPQPGTAVVSIPVESLMHLGASGRLLRDRLDSLTSRWVQVRSVRGRAVPGKGRVVPCLINNGTQLSLASVGSSFIASPCVLSLWAAAWRPTGCLEFRATWAGRPVAYFVVTALREREI